MLATLRCVVSFNGLKFFSRNVHGGVRCDFDVILDTDDHASIGLNWGNALLESSLSTPYGSNLYILPHGYTEENCQLPGNLITDPSSKTSQTVPQT